VRAVGQLFLYIKLNDFQFISGGVQQDVIGLAHDVSPVMEDE
jgi:hypothetical protein